MFRARRHGRASAENSILSSPRYPAPVMAAGAWRFVMGRAHGPPFYSAREALNKSTCADYRQIFSLTRRFFAGIQSDFKENQRSQREKMAVRCA
jgi:hypothetical protein